MKSDLFVFGSTYFQSILTELVKDAIQPFQINNSLISLLDNLYNYHIVSWVIVIIHTAESPRISREHVGKPACLRAQSAAAAGVRPA